MDDSPADHQRRASEGTGHLEWQSTLDPNVRRPGNHRGTGIICTIGPKTNTLETLRELRAAGLDIVRLNFSHGDYEFHKAAIQNVRELQKTQEGRPVAVALDTKGPEIRTGAVRGDGEVLIAPGTEVVITTEEEYADRCDDEYMYVLSAI
jgi:pyruvate kinase